NSQAVPFYDRDAPTYITEGEKDCTALLSIGKQALGTITGANGTPCLESLSPLREFTNLILWPDADKDGKGQRHMGRVANQLRQLGASSSTLQVPGLPDGGGSHDWIEQQKEAGFKTPEQLTERLEKLFRVYAAGGGDVHAFGEDVAKKIPG